ncbi:BppU family phage baseplate upper protein [Lactococcus lactis]|uniref:BppU family phage baseplate upper protein n=1 Tax=Lactococcus lactis TaxID=1358 RepID=UPI001F3F7768|nr:BppU family phage baseplate upper protein [Lactococcus lactis]MCG1000309.1 BppU family phage baseplate upper protein [Lactococcus lactis]
MSHKTLNLDLAKTPILKSIVYGRIGDEDMQTVTVNITSRDTPVDLTRFTITFEGITSGGQTKVFDVDGISSTATGLKAGTFEYTFPNMAFAVAGNYEIAYFSIVKGDKRDTTGEFDIIVDGNADIDAPLAETIITEYNKLVKELHEITDKYISDSDAKFADLNQKIADLQTKITQYQNTVKNTADTAVSTINTTKDSAVSTVNSTTSSAVKTINDALEEFKAGDFYTKAEADAKFATIQSLTDLSNRVIANKGNLASGTDLDNVIDIGTYRIGGLTGGTDIINVPSERSGTTIYAYLTVSGTTTSVVQELIVYDSKTVSQIYSRSRSGSIPTFSPWSKTVMADDSGKVTMKDLVASSITLPNDTDGWVTLQNLHYKKKNGLVSFWFDFTTTAAGTAVVGIFPDGFIPPNDVMFVIVNWTTTTASSKVLQLTGLNSSTNTGLVGILNALANTRYTGHFTFSV